MRKPHALKPGDRIAVVAPASAFARVEFDAGVAELRALGFEPIYEESVFERRAYAAGSATTRAAAFARAWRDPSIAALIAVRGGYGSVHLLPLLGESLLLGEPKAFIGYSDNTSLLSWLTLIGGIVSFHGPMLEGRLARGESGYDRATFIRCLCRSEPADEISHPQVEVLHSGEAAGLLIGGTLTQLCASLGTPYAFDPPAGCVLFLDEVAERPYRLDRMLTQLYLSGILSRASALVFGELPRCDEPGGSPTAREVVEELTRGFRGPILYGLPSGHTAGPTLTLPFGVRARVLTTPRPSLIIEEAAVSA
ncbi:MAG TPA: LD-carboxypeptidase [Vicinamibacterales bacterium]|jgi:muramoyltetrapeptide carboxypeptidase|nr:LD-carboxypeptidase [Vicinamibacterales bacterium]